jgi:4-diphosphocytidyl-2-C-methyl-D-erythritol kinase
MNESLGLPIAWPAPAKLNLCLHILGRRADGYHLLQSAMQFVSLADNLRFYRRAEDCIERVAGPRDIPPDIDLTMRAARLLATETGTRHGVGIELHKQIPVQGGLGGGSSNAATVLVALNHLWNTQLDVESLARLGLRLGADVPLFIRGQAAWAEGVGEQLTAASFAEPVYLIVKPAAAVSTIDIFQAPELTRNSPITTIRGFLATGGRNDCTATVRNRYPEVAEVLDWLGKFADAKLTGTGACVFAAMPDEAGAAQIRDQLPARWTGFVARGLNRSPLLDRLASEPRRHELRELPL